MEKAICLAVVQDVDSNYYSFHTRQTFVNFCETCRDRIKEGEILVVLRGGSHDNLRLEQIKHREWML